MNTARTRLSALFALCLLLCPVRAHAELCTIDAVPAATLLIPYFEVDLSDCSNPEAENTYIRIMNSGAAPALIHISYWTDWSVPVLAYDTNLTGFDVEQIDLRDVLCNGNINNNGPIAPTGDNFITPEYLAHMQAWFQGLESPRTNNCGGSPRNTGTAVGYITIDNVQNAGLFFPNDGDNYFNNAQGTNVLTGHIDHQTLETVEEKELVETVDPEPLVPTQSCRRFKRGSKKKLRCKIQNKIAKSLPLQTECSLETTDVTQAKPLSGYPAVSVEADAGFDNNNAATGFTFYGRYSTNGNDHREPLPSVYSVQYFSTQLDPIETFDLVVWQDPNDNNSGTPVTCGEEPTWAPVRYVQIVAFDEAENMVGITTINIPYETQIVEDVLKDVPFTGGWLFLNLNGLDDMDNAVPRQAYVFLRRNGMYTDNGVSGFGSACADRSGQSI